MLTDTEAAFAKEFAGNPQRSLKDRLLTALFRAGYVPTPGVSPVEAARELHDRPAVRAGIIAYEEDLAPAASKTEWNRAECIAAAQRIYDLTLEEDGKWAPGVAGQMVTLIAKLKGLLVEKKEISTTIRVEELTDEELMQVIARGRPKMIDVTPTTVES